MEASDGRSPREEPRGARPRLRRARLPVRTLPAHRLQPSGRTTCDAAGNLERQPQAAVAVQLHVQHQHADELLARRGDRAFRVPRGAVPRAPRADGVRTRDGESPLRRTRVGAAPQLRLLARNASVRRRGVGSVADRRRVARPAPLGALPLRARQKVPRRDRLAHNEGRRALLLRHARRGREGQIPRDVPVVVAGARRARRGPDDGHADRPRAVRCVHRGGGRPQG